jgi:hypothetical protein
MNKYFVFTTMLAVALCGLIGCEKTTVKGEGDKKLTLTKPMDTSITQGGVDPVKVSISRDKFNDAVEVKITDLPAGVHVQDASTKKIGQDESTTTFNLKADDDAKLVENQVVSVTATGPDKMAATEKFKITVKAKK